MLETEITQFTQTHEPEDHFIDDFSIEKFKLHFDLIQIHMDWSLQTFAHATTALLLQHVHNFVVIEHKELSSKKKQIYIKFQ